MPPRYRNIAISVGIAAVIALSLLWAALAQSPALQEGLVSTMAYGSQVYLPVQMKMAFPTPRPTVYGGMLWLPPALRAELPFQGASVGGYLLAVVAGGGLLLVGALVARQRVR